MLILQDAEQWPMAFGWFGPIPQAEIQDWLHRNRVTLPSDLTTLWAKTGGGDAFESETILRPTVASVPNAGYVSDDIESENQLPAAPSGGLLIFHRGAFLSAIRLEDQVFVTLGDNHEIKNQYRSLDEWYVNTLRAEFGPRYGLDSNKF